MNFPEQLTIKNPNYQTFLHKFKDLFLEKEDLTTQLFADKETKTAKIITRDFGILAGSEEVKYLFPELKFTFHARDGKKITANQEIAKIKGPYNQILTAERLILNVLMRLSGIATKTHHASQIAHPVKLAATRKTIWHYLDKKAVALGGGITHRLNLNQAILIKENHLHGKKIPQILKQAEKQRTKTSFIEIEVENKAQALKANAHPKPLTIMLDNFTPTQIVATLKHLNRTLHTIEASGGITLKNLKQYAATGVDIISMSILTNSTKNLDMSLLF